ncbi:MAG: outer membrane protein assembly factor BamA [Balneolaceae bacterium]
MILKYRNWILLIAIAGLSGMMADMVEAQDREQVEITDPTSLTRSQVEIVEVEVVGVSDARRNFLISTSGLNVGRTISIPGEEIPEGIRRIHRTGLYENVEIDTESVSGGVRVRIVVESKPALDGYVIEGTRRSDRRDIEEQLNLIEGLAVTSSVEAQAVNTIKRFFSEKGYWFTEVEVSSELTDEARNRVTLTFHVDTGERLKVRRIQFQGNEEFSDRRLRRALETIKQDRWWRIFKRHVYTDEGFREAEDNLLAFYRENGFRDARLLQDSVYVYDWRDNKEGVSIDFVIEEGPQYKVRNITWDGNTVYTDEQLSLALGFESGDIFNRKRFDENLNQRRDENDINSLYQNVGYLASRIIPTITEVGEDSLDIHFDIIEDEVFTVREVTFYGNDKTHDDVVRRTLKTVPGNTYSRSAIMRSVRELGAIGYFNPEGIQPDVAPDLESKMVDVIYNLDESQSTDNFELSGGFGGRQIGIIMSARVNFNNFSIQRAFRRDGWTPIPSGDGQKLSLGVQVTGRGYQSYSFTFNEPWLRGRPTSFGVNMSYDILNYGRLQGTELDQKNELFSAGISIGRQLRWPDDYFSQNTTIQYQLYNIAGTQGVFGDGQTDILSIRHQIERNSIDHPISPRTGSRFQIIGEVAPPLPNFAQYYKLRTGYHHHNSIVGNLVLSGSADYGYMGYFDSGTRSTFQRFYLGGTEIQQRQSFINDNIDMRGFPGGTTGVISPLDEDLNLIGGRAFTKYTMELRYPAVTTDQVQLFPYLFMDAGNTYSDLQTFDPFDVKRVLGVGARIYLPILGLIDLSYGYRLDGTPASLRGPGLEAGRWEFLFNMGAQF